MYNVCQPACPLPSLIIVAGGHTQKIHIFNLLIFRVTDQCLLAGTHHTQDRQAQAL